VPWFYNLTTRLRPGQGVPVPLRLRLAIAFVNRKRLSFGPEPVESGVSTAASGIGRFAT
jgi:hypothetical protein